MRELQDYPDPDIHGAGGDGLAGIQMAVYVCEVSNAFPLKPSFHMLSDTMKVRNRL